MRYRQIVKKLKSWSNPQNIASMARFGINSNSTLGISIPKLRSLAKQTGRDHQLAQKLWDSKIHEAKILASMIDDYKSVNSRQMDEWIKGFDSWDVCDETCMNLFVFADPAYKKCFIWSKRKKEFEKRAGFALMASFAFKNKNLSDRDFIKFLPLTKREAKDERNFVRKSVNWSLRQIGKRNLKLNKAALKTAKEISKIKNSKSAHWIAQDAIRELNSPAVLKRLKNK